MMVVSTRKLNPETMPPSADSTDIMRRLRERTAAIHAATEELPLMRALLAPTADANTYGHYLAALHGVYRAVEPVLYAALSPTTLNLLDVRPKLPALQQDLAVLAVPPHALPSASAAPPAAGLSDRMRAAVRDEPSALGGLYVLEGATLGGRVIARGLRQRWGPTCGMPFAFLEFRGPNPGGEWRHFSDGIRQYCALHQDSGPAPIGDLVVAGAVAVFDAMHQGFRDAGTGALT